ncbi:MAG: hypothetical protein B6I20_08525 [Bacteroidetes bacterium 4572_117]|nr:MAG: hypothetical protein B6I20_08525 [Bacteroidetes bacterium 4572_117]
MERFTNPKNLNTDDIYKMPLIKVVYIHGLDSKPLPEKLEIMKQAGMDVSSIHINYRENPDSYPELKKLIVDTKTELIIGSSFGGMLGYWLAEELGVACLLFNPAMVYQSIEVNIPQVKENNCPLRLVVLGELDDVIDPVKNKKFFFEKQRQSLTQKVVSCSWLGHSIDFQTFEEMAFWAARNYSIWKLLNAENANLRSL